MAKGDLNIKYIISFLNSLIYTRFNSPVTWQTNHLVFVRISFDYLGVCWIDQINCYPVPFSHRLVEVTLIKLDLNCGLTSAQIIK